MSDRLWSVEVVIGDTEVAPMDYAGTRVVGPHAYLVINPAADGSIPATIHIDARAPSPEIAQAHALELYRRIREQAQLAPVDNPAVLTVSQVVSTHRPADLWIFEAEEMLDQRRFGLAVIAAQVHLEMSVQATLDALANAAGEKSRR